MTQLLKNAARAALTAPIGAADTSLTVDITKADLFPAADTGTDPVNTVGKDWFKVVLEDVNHNIEIAYVRTRTLGSATMSNVLRGQEGTTAISFASGSIVGLRLTAEDLQDAIDLAAQATTPGKDILWAASIDAQVKKLGSALQKRLVTAFTTAGTGTAYTVTPDPAITAYAAELSFDLNFNVASGDDPTLAISGVATPPNLVKQRRNGTYENIKAGDIPANHRSTVTLLSASQALVHSLPQQLGAGADIASAATLDLTARTGNLVRVTGTTEVTAITMSNGDKVLLTADGALPFNVAGLLTYTCSPEDSVLVWQDNSGTQHAQVLAATGIGPAGLGNRFINGAMMIDQRNAGAAQTLTAGAALAYTVDRWYAYCTGANVTGQRVAGTAPNAYNYQFTGAASVTKIGFAQRIEALNSQDLAGTNATLSVDIANSLLTTVTWTAWYANTSDTFGTLASPTRTQIATGTFTVSSTLTRYNAQISIPGAATTGIEVELSVGAQVSGTWTIGRAQLEPGSAASGFENRQTGVEKALALRYYWKHTGASYGSFAAGLCNSATAARTHTSFPVEMRVAPTLAASGCYILVAANNYAASISASSTGKQGALISWTSSGLTTGQGCLAYPFAATDFFSASAEL